MCARGWVHASLCNANRAAKRSKNDFGDKRDMFEWRSGRGLKLENKKKKNEKGRAKTKNGRRGSNGRVKTTHKYRLFS